jgi:hypothetical protein
MTGAGMVEGEPPGFFQRFKRSHLGRACGYISKIYIEICERDEAFSHILSRFARKRDPNLCFSTKSISYQPPIPIVSRKGCKEL